MNKFKDYIYVFKNLNSYVLKACPIYCLVYCICSILSGISLAVETPVTNIVFNYVGDYAKGKIELKKLLLSFILFFICIAIAQIFNGIINFLTDDFLTKCSGRIEKRFNDKISKLNLINFEDNKFLDEINKAKNGIRGISLIASTINLILFLYIPYFIFISVYLYKVNHILVFSILIMFVPIAISQIIKVKLYSNLEDKVAPIRREYEYYEKCMIDREYFKETRILGIFPYFNNLYKDVLGVFNKEKFKTEKKTAIMEMLFKLLTILGFVIVLLILVKLVLENKISFGAFGAIFGSLIMFIALIREVLCMHISNINELLGCSKNFIKFMDTYEKEKDYVSIDDVPYIDFKNVSFSYPYANKKSISNVSFHIDKGDTIAIVGENGAGKSTFVKLLMGMYLPTEGEIYFNGYNTKDIQSSSIFKNVSSVFQNFQKYKMTLKDNISISDINLDDEDLVLKCSNKADIDVNKKAFPNGYETMLSKEFDGVDLSGGQWQRVAIARGFYKNHNMIVLDEPTAAIDPIEETKLYKKFKEMSYGKTAIIVTHRLGSAKIANKIIVLDKGKIVQIGNHDDLMKVDGKYREMYNAQSKWYQNNI